MKALFPEKKPPLLLYRDTRRVSDTLRVAISGKSGCGNSTISKLLAKTLDITCINYTFRNLAHELDIPLEEIARRAKKDRSVDFHLDHMQINLAQASACVLASRLAIWLLPEAQARVYLKATPEVRAARIQKREGGTIEQVHEKTAIRDEADERRYKKFYGIDINDYDFADLVVETDTLSPKEIVQDIREYLRR